MDETNLWVELGNECLLKALDLLKKEPAPTAATAGTVKSLVYAAVSMAEFNYHLENEIPSLPGVRAFRGPPFWKREEES